MISSRLNLYDFPVLSFGFQDCLSIPSILNQNGIYRHLNLTLNQDEVGMLRGSAGVLKEVLGQLDI